MNKLSIFKLTACSIVSLMILLSGCAQPTMTTHDETKTKMMEPMKEESKEMKSSTDTMKEEPMMNTTKGMDDKTMDQKKDVMMK